MASSSTKASTFGYDRTNDLWPFTLIDSARSFAAVADAGVVGLGRPDAGGPHYLTILFLLSQAIENALKSHLLICAVTEGELMKIGHDLPRALTRTETAGWPAQHPADHFLLKVIDACYRQQKQLQYHRARAMTLPLLRPVRELAHEYISRLRAPLLRGSSAHGEIVDASTAGWSIDPKTDYGGPTLAQFREGAPSSGEISDLTETPRCSDEAAPSQSPA